MLLLLFKLIDATGTIAAYLVGLSALLGGVLLISGSIGVFLADSIPHGREDKELGIMLEKIGLGVILIFAAIIFFHGKILK